MSAAINKLKEQARRHEHEHDWEGAIAAYLEVLAVYDELEEERDLALYNRVGDLYLRVGRIADAVDYYETAADRYAEAGLGNNAIALCNKALRYQPNRLSLYRKLTVYSAQEGFQSDARRWYLEYAARMERAGALREAMESLDRIPGLGTDPQVRETLGRRLVAHGAREAGLSLLLRAHRLWLDAGEPRMAEAVAEEIARIDPDFRPNTGMDTTEQGAFASAPPVVAPGRPDFTAAPSELGLESVAAAAGLEDPADEPEPLTELPLIDPMEAAAAIRDFADEPVGSPAVASDASIGSTVGPAGAAGNAGFYAGPEPEAEPLPLIYPGEEPGDGTTAEEVVAPPTAHAQPADASRAAAILDAADEHSAAGRDAAAREELERGHAALAEAGDWRGALQVATALARHGSDDEAAFTRCVEYAVRTGDPDALVDALLSLGGFYERKRAQRRATIVYQRVLDIDPSNDRARRGLQRAEKMDGTRVAASARSNTRFTLPEKPPSGDDARDFSEMLALFKKKLAQGVGRDDSTSHYDLGLAFREMGLINEAITEFQTALRAGEHQLKVYEELGACFMLSGRYNVAEKVLARALQLPHESDEELAGIHFHLAQCYEAMGQADRAEESYRIAASLHPRIADIANRGTGL